MMVFVRRKGMRWIGPCFVLAVWGLILVGCTKGAQKSEKRASVPSVVRALPGDEIILEYHGGAIKAQDIQEKVQPQLAVLEQQILNAYIKAAEDLFVERMDDPSQTQSSQGVTDTELQSYLKSNRIGPEESEKIRKFLAQEKKRIHKQLLTTKLYQDLGVKNRLTAIRYDLAATEDMPQKGPATAPLTLQLFCDFGNPTCHRSRLALYQLMTEFPNKVRWIYRHFPVASSPVGMDAARVAICAHQQKKFWELYDQFLDQQSQLKPDNLMKIAGGAGVDIDRLTTCLQTRATQDALDRETRAAQLLGITATPVYFINGVRVSDVDQVFNEVRKVLGQKVSATN